MDELKQLFDDHADCQDGKAMSFQKRTPS